MWGEVSIFNCSVLTFVLFLVLKKWLGINKWGKKDKLSIRKIQILLRFVRQVARGVAFHAMFTTK